MSKANVTIIFPLATSYAQNIHNLFCMSHHSIRHVTYRVFGKILSRNFLFWVFIIASQGKAALYYVADVWCASGT